MFYNYSGDSFYSITKTQQTKHCRSMPSNLYKYAYIFICIYMPTYLYAEKDYSIMFKDPTKEKLMQESKHNKILIQV
jgi:hypothetical protein